MHVHFTIVHRRGNDTRVQSRQLKCFYICCGTLQYSQRKHKENPRGTQDRSSSLWQTCSKIPWGEWSGDGMKLKAEKCSTKIFSSIISSNCFENPKFSIISKPNEKKLNIFAFTSRGWLVQKTISRHCPFKAIKNLVRFYILTIVDH